MEESESPFVVRGGPPGPREPHYFIRYRDVQPLASEVSAITAYVLNRLLQTRHSASRLRKLGTLDLTWSEGHGTPHAVRLSFEDLARHIREQRTLNPSVFDLPPINCEWLDGSMTSFAKRDAPIARADGSEFATFTFPLPYGGGFPITPTLDREGAVYLSLQGPLMQNVVNLYDQLVQSSDRTPSLDMMWLNGFRMLLNDCIALVDVTLHQLYFMAQHRGAERGWRFDTDALGGREGQRLRDKLAWIGRITKRPLDDARREVSSFTVLKDLRNHLTHFDPPCFAYTVEDATAWLNGVADVGRLLWRMRDKMDAQLSPLLITLILLRPLAFTPSDPSGPRVVQPPDVGYGSTSWGPRIKS